MALLLLFEIKGEEKQDDPENIVGTALHKLVEKCVIAPVFLLGDLPAILL